MITSTGLPADRYRGRGAVMTPEAGCGLMSKPDGLSARGTP